VIRRVRMARKRLAIARERDRKAFGWWVVFGLENAKSSPQLEDKWKRRAITLRAIERRKDKIA